MSNDSYPYNHGTHRNLDSSSDSGRSSYNDSVDRPDPEATRVCRWRNDIFNHEECSRYFDCPSHTIERALSDIGSGISEGSIYGSGDDEEQPAHEGAGDIGNQRRAHDHPSDRDEAEDQGRSRPDAAAGQQEPQSSEIQPSISAADEEDTQGSGPVAAELPHRSAPQQQDDGERERDVHESMGAGASAADQVGPSEPTEAPLPPLPLVSASPDASSRRRSSAAHSAAPGSLRRRSDQSRSTHAEVSLPRWQPDAEATLCPICRTQFSFFVRKHHCRKCGRVVCNSCSPHRITIPYQYIVQPPDQARMATQRYPSSLIGGEGGYADFINVGGGERVRLCNPCVPDPNNTPPRPQGSPTQVPSPRGPHHRSRSNVDTEYGGVTSASRYQSYFTGNPVPDPYNRHRSVTHSNSAYGSAAGPSSSSRAQYYSTQNRILAGTPPTYHPASSGYPGSRYRSMLDIGQPSGSSSSAAAQNRALPPPPPQIAEEDECPVCHRELPPRSLANFEALRESHITACITSHSSFGGRTPTATEQGPESSSNTGAGAGETPPRPGMSTRRTGMFPYVATEKDCVDAAECTICLEDFEPGVQMARLECLCRFHRSCISAWFINHPGRCPVHQHDGFGY